MSSERREAKAGTSDKRKRRSPEELRERIITAAAEEFRRVGYASATTAAIAKNAGVTEAQLFRYYQSKANLFREAVFNPLDKQFLNFFARYAANDSAERDLRRDAGAYIADLQQFLGENADMLVSLLTAQRYDQDMARQVSAIESLSAYFERGAALMGSNAKDDAPVSPELMVRVSFAAVLGCVLFKEWLFPEGIASDDDIRGAVNDFVLEGISVMHDDIGSS